MTIVERVTTTTKQIIPIVAVANFNKIGTEKIFVHKNEYHYSGAAEFIQNG
jgi:hypothetical protein